MICAYARVSTIDQTGPNKTSIGEQLAKCKGVVRVVLGKIRCHAIGKYVGIIVDQYIPIIVQMSMTEKVHEFLRELFIGILCPP